MKTIYFVLSLSTMIMIFVTSVFSNGGPQKLVDDVLISLAYVPLSPLEGEKISFLPTFVNATKAMQKENATSFILKDNASIKIWAIDPFGNKVFELPIKNVENDFVIFDFQHTFEKPGMYELFFKFNLSSAPGKTYTADFPIQVREKETLSRTPIFIYLIIFILSFALGWFLKCIPL